MRIVSLLPSATEIVCALGAGDQLVGVSHECDFPSSVKGLPVLTSARIGTGSSAQIDRAVRDVIDNALSIYRVDDQLLAQLQPDVIVTQDLCEVCAVSLDDVRAAVARIAHREDIQIVSLSPTRLHHVMDDIDRVAAVLKTPSIRPQLERRIAAIRERALGGTKPRVATLEWIDPIMIGGTWMPELVELAGGIPIGATAGAPAPTVSLDNLTALAPDVVVVKPCGFSIARSLEERDLLLRITERLPTARVYLTDGNAYFNRPGPRLVESLEIMATCVDPAKFADFLAIHGDAICVDLRSNV
ncbi:MAG: cobalamin-binding protein [Kofleriaceae bacterium]